MRKTTYKATGIAAMAALMISGNANAQCISGNCVDGYGVYQTDDFRYTGFFNDGIPNGHGILIWASGDCYIGEFKEKKRDGEGTYYFSDGGYLRGYFKNGQKHGPNNERFSDNSLEKGFYNEGKETQKNTGCLFGSDKDGFGVVYYKDDSRYEGYFKKGLYYGHGKLTHTDGSIYEGNFKDGKYNGYGVLYTATDTTDGIWENDKFQGALKNQKGCVSGDCKNSYSVLVDDDKKYIGEFMNSLPHGMGKFVFSNGDKYEGSVAKGNMEGYGTYEYFNNGNPDGKEKYVGDFKNNQPHGYGALIYRNGDAYYGQFSNGVFNGQGIFEKKGMEPEAAVYRNGTLSRTIPLNEVDPIFGDRDGYGLILTRDGRYNGELEDGVPNGRGMLEFYNGLTVIGEFDEGKANGQCIAESNKGDQYYGQMNNNKIQGRGVMVTRGGKTLKGTFRNGNLTKEDINTSVAAPKISWTEPKIFSTQVKDGKAKLKICVASSADVSEVEIYDNGILKVSKPTSGIKYSGNSLCDYAYEFDIELEPGSNEINAKVKNEGGSTVSESRYITWEENDALSSQKRVALIIGNGAYQNVLKLPNAANDAKLMDETLNQLGFECLTYTNISRSQIKEAVYEFGEKIAEQKAVGLFYYAGHGIQVDGVNYLVPVEAALDRREDVEDVCFSIDKIMGEMKYAGNDLNIIILDACRDDPFVKAKATRSVKNTEDGGLAQVNAPKGTYIAYSTSPGKVASDGSGQNGLYTEQLAKAMKVPGDKLEDVFKRVRNEVFRISREQMGEGKEQIPWENSSVFGDFRFMR